MEVVFKDIDYSIVIDVEKYFEKLKEVLPFKSTTKVWKEEVYFSTPLEISVLPNELVHKVHRGGVFYWPPEKALCLFYGLTQPYTPVIYIGNIVDPVNILTKVREGFTVEVFKHELNNKFKEVADMLRRNGYTVATPIRDGERIVAAYKYRDGRRYSIQLYIESYGIYMESEGFVRFRDDDLVSYIELLKLKNNIVGRARLDLSEDKLIIISATTISIEELEEALHDVEKSLENLDFISRV